MGRIDFLKVLVAVSIVAVLTLPGYMIFYLLPAFDGMLIERVEDNAEHIAKHLALMFFGRDGAVEKGSLPLHLTDEVAVVRKDFDLYKVKIYSARGETVFSTEAKDIGKINDKEYFHSTVGRGRVYSTVVNKDGVSLEGQPVPIDVVETYVPVMRDGSFAGAFEIYHDITVPRQRFMSFVRRFHVTLFTITVTLLLAVALSGAKAFRSMRERALAEEMVVNQAADLKRMNTELTTLYEISRRRQEEVMAAQQERYEALQRVQEEMARTKEVRLELLRHIVKTQEYERARIARELHDETAQVLTAASLNMEAVKRYVGDSGEGMEIIERVKKLCRQMSDGLYRMVHDLRPAQLDDLGLVPALEHLTETGATCEALKVELRVVGEPRRLEPFAETVLYRAAQEALTNVARHAGVGEALVELEYGTTCVVLRVTDHGLGFDPDRIKLVGRSGWGLAGIRERVDAVDGRFLVKSAPGEGTVLEVSVPVLGERLMADGNGREA